MLIAVLLQTFSAALVVSEYFANRKFITEQLCENRSQPQLHCNGKCYLKKKLANESEGQKSEKRNRTTEEVVVLFFEHNEFGISSGAAEVADLPIYRSRNDVLATGVERSVFHPPSLFV